MRLLESLSQVTIDK